MASNTTRLGLLKKDPLADGADTFNIKTMLNDNWDKIDSKVATLGPDGKVPAEQLNVQAPPDASTTQKGVTKLNDATNSTSTTEAATANAVRKAKTEAKEYTDTAPEAMLRKTGRFRKTNSQKDPNIRTYLVREYRRKDGTLFARSVLSDPNAEGKPTVRTETFYEADGVTEIVADRMVFDIVYDADGDYKEEIPR